MPRKKKETPVEEKKPIGLWKNYESAEEALSAIKGYFQMREDEGQLYYGEVDLALGIGVPLAEFRSWRTGSRGQDFKDVADWAYMTIAAMYETNVSFNEDKVAARKAAFMMKQPCFQGYSEKNDNKADVKVTVKFGKSGDASDYE